MLYVDIRK